ncbi:MAG: manganese catalase family protein [Clostridia bacterium]
MESISLEDKVNQYKTIPYPSISNLRPNTTYATLLYDDFSGNLGELSAVLQYVYEHIQFVNYAEISKVMLSIAIQEMRHLDLVGNLIKTLGRQPTFISSMGETWSAKDIRYKTGNLQETMTYNIQTEKAAIAGYKKAIGYTKNRDIQKLFDRIILDEENHISIFQAIIQKNGVH